MSDTSVEKLAHPDFYPAAKTRHSLRDLLAVEWMKVRLARSWWILLLAGLTMSLVTSYGYAVEGRNNLELLASGQGAPGWSGSVATVTSEVSRAWMMMFLFAGILGALTVSREFGNRTLGRSVLLLGSRRSLFQSKLAVAGLIGGGFGLVAAIGATVTPLAMMSPLGLDPVWTSDTTWTVVGVFACNVFAALAGVFVGWLITNPIGAITVVVGLTLLLDPGLQRLVPEAAKFLFTIALSSIYRDDKPELLGIVPAVLVVLAWLAVIGLLARRAVLRRDVD